MPKRKEPTPTKASDSLVCKLLSKLIGLPACSDLESVHHACADADRIDPLLDLIQETDALYAWQVNIAADVMSDKTTPLTEHLMSTPGRLHIVRDTVRGAADSSWLAVADVTPTTEALIRQLPHRGLIHSYRVAGEISQVLAIQISSCR